MADLVRGWSSLQQARELGLYIYNPNKTYTYWHQDPLNLPLTDANRAVGKHSGAGGVFGKLYQLFTFTQDEVRRLTIM